jgi:predicted acetylornithine/succinylornithine family transaminase
VSELITWENLSDDEPELESGARVKNADYVAQADQCLFGNYRRAPLAFSHGFGSRLFDVEGKGYLDFIGGVAVSSLGHAHPRLVEAISAQAGRYLHASNLYQLPEQIKAAQMLIHLSGLQRVFFCNSGTEANEMAIKLARKHASEKGRGPRILVAHNSFHGRTIGSLAAPGNPAYHKGFEPLPGGFEFFAYNELTEWQKAMGPDVAAILVEPVQGEGGVFPGTLEFLHGLEELCRQHGALFMLDEVQTGVGRTGTMFCYHSHGLQPDVVTLAKGLGGGVPVGAVLATEEAAAVMVPGTHGCTFGGNALATAAAQVVLEEVELLLMDVEERSRQLVSGLAKLPHVTGVRAAGLLIGVDLDVEARPVELACLEQGLLVNSVRAQTLRLAPPLVVTEEDVQQALEILGGVLAK